MSFRRRLTVLVGASVALSIATAATVLFLIVNAQLYAQLDQQLADQRARSRAWRRRSSSVVRRVCQARPLRRPLRRRRVHRRRCPPRHHRPVSSRTSAARPWGLSRRRDRATRRAWCSSSRAPGSRSARPIRPRSCRSARQPPPWPLQAPAATSSRTRWSTAPEPPADAPGRDRGSGPGRPAARQPRPSAPTLRWILVAISIGGVVVAAALGRAIANSALRPVARLTVATERVAGTRDLSERVEEPGHDELGRLAHSFNRMLTALDESERSRRQLVADARTSFGRRSPACGRTSSSWR